MGGTGVRQCCLAKSAALLHSPGFFLFWAGAAWAGGGERGGDYRKKPAASRAAAEASASAARLERNRFMDEAPVK